MSPMKSWCSWLFLQAVPFVEEWLQLRKRLFRCFIFGGGGSGIGAIDGGEQLGQSAAQAGDVRRAAMVMLTGRRFDFSQRLQFFCCAAILLVARIEIMNFRQRLIGLAERLGNPGLESELLFEVAR